MSDLVVETSGLRKVYGGAGRRLVAVDDLDLQVPRGGVHGFLGPNGSGKTTTIRMLLGLARPTKGTVTLFGEDAATRLPELLPRVGAVVEGAGCSDWLTVQRSLQLLARAAGVGKDRAGEVIERVGLSNHARRRCRTLSPGLRQRLAIAAALLRSPELLVLDEPTNGLDPGGIRDIRELVAGLGAAGTTVLLSSHNLAEVQQVCSSVSIIGDGKLLASGPVDELLGESVARTRVGVRDLDAAEEHLRGAGYEVSRSGAHLLVEGHEHPADVSRVLAEHQLYVEELSVIRPDLEAFFLRLTGHAPREEER